MEEQFKRFLISAWELEVWAGERIISRSKKAGVAGLLAFIQKYDKKYKDLVIFDKIVGRGAALLVAYLKAKAVYGALGSKLAVQALKKFKIEFYFKKTVPNILNRDKTGLCPFEKLSLNKTPEEFYNCLRK